LLCVFSRQMNSSTLRSFLFFAHKLFLFQILCKTKVVKV
jgi:hypothetical protein